MPDIRIVLTVMLTSWLSSFFRSKMSEVWCCLARSRSWTKEGILWFWASRLSPSESMETE